MTTFTVKARVDAWAIYTIEVEADSAEDAREMVKRGDVPPNKWGEPEYVEFDDTDYEVEDDSDVRP